MKRYAKGVLLLVLALVTTASAQTFRQFTITDLLKVRRVGDPQLSPDGRTIAYTVTDMDLIANRGIPQIYLVPVAGGGADVYPDCTTDDCNKKRDQQTEDSKVKAKVIDRLLYRHWNAWKDNKRTHIFVV